MSLALKKEIISLIDNANIDDESMKHIKDYIKMHIKNNNDDNNALLDRKRRAFKRLFEISEMIELPANFNEEEALQNALKEKYGSII